MSEEIEYDSLFIDIIFECLSTTGESYCAVYDLSILSLNCPLNCESCSSFTTCTKSYKEI